jgi:predicted ArsR family transcriptional regulator
VNEHDKGDEDDPRLRALAALDEPLRRRVYGHVIASRSPVRRDDLAAALGVARSVAAFHLDKLASVGLLDVEYRRPPGRAGPGAGRPAKLYRRASAEVSMSVPERHYDLVGRLLADAVVMASRQLTDPTEAAQVTARGHGRALGREVGTRSRDGQEANLDEVAHVLRGQGYEPRVHDDAVYLENCPFHAVAEEQRDLVCGMNVELVRGLIEGMDLLRVEARFDPEPGRCCVSVHERRRRQRST